MHLTSFPSPNGPPWNEWHFAAAAYLPPRHSETARSTPSHSNARTPVPRGERCPTPSLDANGGHSRPKLSRDRKHPGIPTHPLCGLLPCLPNLHISLLHLRCRALNTVATMLTCRPDVGSCATRPSTAPIAGPSRIHRLPCMQTWDPASDPSHRLIIRTLCGTVHPPRTACLVYGS